MPTQSKSGTAVVVVFVVVVVSSVVVVHATDITHWDVQQGSPPNPGSHCSLPDTRPSPQNPPSPPFQSELGAVVDKHVNPEAAPL